MGLSESDRLWYQRQIRRLDPHGEVIIECDLTARVVTYAPSIRSDESLRRDANDEELVRALVVALLVKGPYRYPPTSLYIEKWYQHGHPSSMHDEVDLLIFDVDGLPYAMWELKAPNEYDHDFETFIRLQLFGTAPLVGAPHILAYATIRPNTAPTLTVTTIDRSVYPSYPSWDEAGRPASTTFPADYTDPSHTAFIKGGPVDLRFDCTHADFRAAATAFHAEFFGEHPDNVLFTNLMKCLLAKILDERQTATGNPYSFQVMYSRGREETAATTFARINTMYESAYRRYIDPGASDVDDINPREFAPERLKTVVRVLQGMSITRGAALHTDVIGAFFEEVLRSGFKQDKGMYFTHSNLVRFMVAAMDLDGLAVQTWMNATHPDNRLPYVIDPACGSGSFLLCAMPVISEAIRSRRAELVRDMDAEAFFNARMSDDNPNYWAERFVYGIDPKFVMAITAKVNMVLHGDGSAHIFKADALSPWSSMPDTRFRPVDDPQRVVPRNKYAPDVVESFDAVISNPPFGITLSAEAKRALPTSFSLKSSSASELLFLERWFQLLRGGGRLGVVVPESLLNTSDASEARVFLYRMFWIRAVVSLPRSLFIETPTLTSLLFAQKKGRAEIDAWDREWEAHEAAWDKRVEDLKRQLRPNGASGSVSEPEELIRKGLAGLLDGVMFLTKKGDDPVAIALPPSVTTFDEARKYYLRLLGMASIRNAIRNAVFAEVANSLDYAYPVYAVDEVGYKLSKRKERLRPNQLALFRAPDGRETPNLHLVDGEVEVVIDSDHPSRVLDFLRRDVRWA